MGKRVTNLIDAAFDGLHWRLVEWELRDPNTSTAADLHLLLFLVTVVLSAYPVLCYLTVLQNQHVLFWLGVGPQHAVLVAPGALLLVSVGMLVLQRARASQHFVRMAVLVLFMGSGAAVAVAGIHVLRTSTEASEALLLQCGTDGPMTHHIEAEWQRLFQFHQACTSQGASKPLPVHECPGFAGMLTTPHALYAEYLEEVEKDFHCSGFCKFWAPALFTTDVQKGRRCASALGEDLGNIGHFVGLPMVGIGLAFAVIGAGLSSYDHL